MKKKILSVVLVGALAVSMGAMAGCGNSDSSSDSSSDTTAAEDADAGEDTETAEEDATDTEEATEEESEQAVASEGGDSLTVWCWDPAFNIASMEMAESWYQDNVNPDFTLNIEEVLSADCETRLITAATSGDLGQLPDIVLMQDNSYQKYVQAYPEAFTDLTDSGIAFDQFPEYKVAYSVVDGRNYGVPFDNGAETACYRIDILEEAGYTIDDMTDLTWPEWIEIGKDIKDKTGKSLISVDVSGVDIIFAMLQSAGASMFNDDGSANFVGNDALVECINYYKEAMDEGVIQGVNSWDEYISTITNSEVAGTINGCWIGATIMSVEDFSGLWDITNMPALVETEGATNYSNNGGSSWYITSNCQNVELAEDFLGSTFAGSVEFYEEILPTTSAIATYLPAGDSEVYSEPQEFWNDQPIYERIVEFASKTPSNNHSALYYDANTYIATAVTDILNGSDIDSELQLAQDSLDADAAALGY